MIRKSTSPEQEADGTEDNCGYDAPETILRLEVAAAAFCDIVDNPVTGWTTKEAAEDGADETLHVC